MDSVEVGELDSGSDFKPGCLTTFVKNFRDVLEEMISDNITRTTVSSTNINFQGLGRSVEFWFDMVKIKVCKTCCCGLSKREVGSLS